MLKRIAVKGKIMRHANSINALAESGEDLQQSFPNLFKRLGSIQPIALDPDKYYYFRNRAVSVYEVHGLNDNGDGFERDELQKKYATFIGCPSSVDHITEDQVGIIVDSVFIPFKGVFRPSEGKFISANIKDAQPGDLLIGDWVENIHALDREVCAKNHPELIPGIESGQITDTSMGCYARYAVCTACGNVAYSEDQFCNCVKSSKGRKIVKAGTNEEIVVGELNKDIKFFEDTIVLPLELQGKAGGAGADPGAKVLQIISSLKPYTIIRTADDEDKDDEDEKKENKEVEKLMKKKPEDVNKLGGVPDSVQEKMDQLDEQRRDEAEDNEKGEQPAEEVSGEASAKVENYNIAKVIVDKLSEVLESIKDLVGKPKEEAPEKQKKNEEKESLEIGAAIRSKTPEGNEIVKGGETLDLPFGSYRVGYDVVKTKDNKYRLEVWNGPFALFRGDTADAPEVAETIGLAKMQKENKSLYMNVRSSIVVAKIVHLKSGKWQVQSEKGKNMGTYDTEEEAKKRLKQVEFFKHKKGCVMASLMTKDNLRKVAAVNQATLKTLADIIGEQRVETVDGRTGIVVGKPSEDRLTIKFDDGTTEEWSAAQVKVHK